MQFNSLEFLFFSILFFLLWPVFRKKSNSRWIFIVIASFIFYGWWDWRFLFLILGSGLVDFFCGLGIYRTSRFRKAFLWTSILANLGLLSIFKYSLFFASGLEGFFQYLGLQIDLANKIPEFVLILPVGISFYTFQSLSYTIDIYKKKLTPTRNIFHFFSYLAMFPQLVAGPIVRAKDFLQQLRSYKVPDYLQKWHSIKLICYGLFQKMVIADNLSFFIDSAFEGKTMYDGSLYWWMVMIAFSFQIYCDFSGYTLIAKGLAKYMGYNFKMNFNHPYLSQSLKEFWSRWHISLSTWFRDYVYIPLGGSKRGLIRMILALIITMILSGLWHGANYTFLFWALIHTVLLLFEKLSFKRFRIRNTTGILTLLVFIQVTIAWVYFRAESVQQGHYILAELFSFGNSNFQFFLDFLNELFFLVWAILIEIGVLIGYRHRKMTSYHRKYNLDIVFVTTSILSILFLRGEGSQFIYFQF